MQNKVCVITGATSGIGKATALGLAKMGATVIIIGRDQWRGKLHKRRLGQERQFKDRFTVGRAFITAEICKLAEEIKARYQGCTF